MALGKNAHGPDLKIAAFGGRVAMNVCQTTIVLLANNPIKNALWSVRLYCHCDAGASFKKIYHNVWQMACRKSWKARNPKVTRSALCQIMLQFFNISEPFKYPRDLAQQQSGFLGWQQLPVLAYE